MPLLQVSEYAWADFEIVLAGRPLVRFLSFRYSIKQDTKPIYGRGNTPLGVQRGNKSFEGEIKIGQSELEALILSAQATGRRLEDIDYTLVMSYAKGGVVVVDRAIGVVFEGYEKAMEQGADSMEVSLAFKCVDIIFNINGQDI